MISLADHSLDAILCVARSDTPPSQCRQRLVLHECALSSSKPRVTMLSKAASHKPIGAIHLQFTGQPIYTHARPPSVVRLPSSPAHSCREDARSSGGDASHEPRRISKGRTLRHPSIGVESVSEGDILASGTIRRADVLRPPSGWTGALRAGGWGGWVGGGMQPRRHRIRAVLFRRLHVIVERDLRRSLCIPRQIGGRPVGEIIRGIALEAERIASAVLRRGIAVTLRKLYARLWPLTCPVCDECSQNLPGDAALAST